MFILRVCKLLLVTWFIVLQVLRICHTALTINLHTSVSQGSEIYQFETISAANSYTLLYSEYDCPEDTFSLTTDGSLATVKDLSTLKVSCISGSLITSYHCVVVNNTAEQDPQRLCVTINVSPNYTTHDFAFVKPFYTGYLVEEQNGSTVSGLGDFYASVSSLGPISSLQYHISPSDQFEIVVEEITCYKYPKIVSTRPLDREQAEFYLVTVEAFFDGNALRRVSTEVRIHLVDINDNTPIFVSTSDQVVSISEQILLGTQVLQIVAVDLDTGNNAVISYALRNPSNVFVCNRITGSINILSPLDYESDMVHALTVVARDSGIPGLSAEINITINIVDVNEVAPLILLPAMPVALTASSVAVSISVSDSDSTSVSLSMSGRFSESFELRRLSPFQFELILTNFADIPSDTVDLLLTAVDNGAPPLTSTAILTIQVPVGQDQLLPSGFLLFEVVEGVPIGSYVGRVELQANVEAYRITNGNTPTWFSISSAGDLTTVSNIDYEIETQFNLTIEVMFSGEVTGLLIVVIDVVDINDNSPHFLTNVTATTVPESADVIFIFSASDDDGGCNGAVHYYLQYAEPDVFTLDPFSGILSPRYNGAVDYERFRSARVSVKAIDQAPEHPQLAETLLDITITDTNDHAPIITPIECPCWVVEEDASRQECRPVTAYDLDVGSSSIQFSIQSGNNHNTFGINQNTGVVFTRSSLDHEVQAVYYLAIVTSDGVHDSVPVNLTIIVIDINDSPPTYTSSSLQFTVAENLEVGHMVASVAATHSDAGYNALTNYNFGDGTSSSVHNTFRLDPASGMLFLRAPLSTTNSPYIFTVQAMDRLLNTQSASTMVEINVSPPPNQPPFFLLPEEHRTVASNSPVGTRLFQATAFDPDGDGLSYAIVPAHNTFNINENTGLVTLATTLSLSETDYNLVIVVTDNGSPSLSASMSLQVSVYNPTMQFNSFTYNHRASTELCHFNLSLSEEATSESTVMVLSSSTQYSLIQSEFSDSFYVDGNILRFRSTSRPILTERQSIPLNLRAINSSNNFEICSVTINILDVNNSPPRFAQPSVMIEIYRNTPVGSTIFQAVAVDQDKGSLAVTSYSLTTNSNFFEIDSITGFVSITSLLTNSATRYSLVITATDGERSDLTDQITLTVTLLGNTNAPATFTSSATVPFTVSEAQPIGYIIHNLTISDDDPGVYGRQSFCIATGDPRNLFSVQSDGSLVINQKLDRENSTQASYQLTVIAYDESPNPKNSTDHGITINVMEINDEIPTFLSSSYSVSIFEDIMTGTEVIRVQAVDRDPNTAGVITYSLVDNLSHFTISTSGGVISTTSGLDREETATYRLTVLATDGGTNPQLTGTVAVSIEVLDRNDNSPQFDNNSPVQMTIPEDTDVGSTVLQLSASDDDTGLNGEVVFAVQSVESPFALDPIRGSITVSRSLDYESAPTGGYQLQITATDRGNPSQSSEVLMVTLRVRDNNEMPPQFENSSYSFVVPESSTTGVSLFSIMAVDRDQGSGVQYSLMERQVSDSAFEIDSSTGAIQLRRSLDRNAFPFHQLEITATDTGSPQLTSSVLVHVEITATSVASPLFTSPYFIQVSEDAQVNSSVLWIHAEGYNPANLGNVVYNIISGDVDTWGIIPTTGVFYLRSSLNHSLMPEYILTVRASRDGASSTGETQVTIQVLPANVDRLPPSFDPDTDFVIQVAGDATAGVSFTTLQAVGMSPFQYYIDGGTGFGVFALSNTGELSSLLLPLSLLPSSAYILTTTVEDINGLRETKDFIVDVSELNHSPWFSSPVYYSTLRESTVDTIVACVTAEDTDTGANGRVHYSIINENTPGQFAVNSTTGEVSILSDPLDYESSPESRMLIQAIDDGLLSTTTLLVVTVEDVNDRRPQIQPADIINIDVFNNFSPEREVMRLFVSDQDSFSNRAVRYTSSNNDHFFVNSTTGAVMRTTAMLNDGDSFTIVVTAQNVAQPPLDSVRNITLVINVVLPMSQPSLTITPQATTINVREDTLVASVVYDVNATGSGLVMYGFIETQSHFAMHPNSGEVYLAAPLDREQQSSYILLIEARDGDQARAVLSLSVTVDDVNDNAPRFNQTVYQFSVNESVDIGHVVGNINAIDLDNDTITYSIIQGRTSLSAAMFNITSTGQLLTAQSLDREQLALHELIVEASDGNSIDRSMVFVTVIDENDFTPTFSRSSYTITVTEDTTIATVILTVSAFDLDQGSNGIINYQLTSSTSYFSVNSTTGDVTLTSSLDYEDLSHHTFNISASDAVFSSTAVVMVMVSDIPDDPPQLCNLTQTVTIKENLFAFTPVASINKCSGEGLVEFNITSGNELGHFVVDPSSGVVFSTIMLDREQVEQYTLIITAIRTIGGPPRNVPLTITIEDENDNSPQLNPPIVVVDVSENSPVSTILYTFNITDRDSGDNGDISIVRIYDFPATQYFMIDTGGQLMLRRALDRESLFQSIRFQVYIYDSGTPPMAAAYSVTVNVLDFNEAPSFTSSTYTVSIAIPILLGSRVLFVVAVDKDDDEFGLLQYSISGGNGSEHFSIDPQSGGVMVSNNFFMQPALYHVTVVVTDGGGLQDTCDVFVLTQECPDSTLLFQPNVYTVDVFENAPLDTVLYTPVLLNFGMRNSNGIDFSFSVTNSTFTISITSGVVMLNKSLDRELQSVYQLAVQAVDQTRRFAVSYVTVVVLDINDNHPLFQNTPYVAFIEDSITVGSFVTRVSATDLDTGRNAEIVYSLPSQSFGLFSINATTGEVHIDMALNGLVLSSPIQLTVQAQDGGETPLSSETVVSIHVMDSRAPLFSPLTYTANVSEDAMIGTPVVTVSAVSRSGTGGAISYTIEGGDDLSQFTIGAVSGEVSVHMFLDYEAVQEYRLELQALDMAASLSTITFLVISVIDVNDNRPVFTEGIYTAAVLENATLDTMLTQVSAMDIDTGVNREITYRLPSNSYPGVFRVDQDTGWVSLSGALDRESACSNLHQNQPCLYNFPVQAIDGGTPPLTGTAQVRIAVGNINDNSPEFTEEIYTFSVEEDEAAGVIVGFVVAIDVDGDDVQYSLVTGGDDGRFILDTDTGQLTLNSTFSDIDPVEYILNVSACDPFLLCGSATVNVLVIDINNHFPIFTEAVYETNVPENVRVREPFFTILATDGDRGSNAAILYRIQDSFTPFFTINNTTGEISAAVSLDRETRPFYELLVFAVDGGGLSGAATVRLIISDVNDNVPRFSLTSYTTSVPEVLPVNSILLRVNAEDSDAGANGTLSYSIIPPVGTDLGDLQFRIDSLTGEISVRLTLIGPTVVNFTVAVTDQGIPPLTGVPASVSVTILNANRSPPIFSEPFYNASVLEEQPRNTFVLNIIATAINETVFFEFLSLSNQFMIFGNNGTIVTTRTLDREEEDEYTLQVRATVTYNDGIVDELNSFVAVYIRVTDVNEVPRFLTSRFSFSILENAPIMATILPRRNNITGQDRDLGDNGVIRYQLLPNDDPFYINSVTGVLHVNGSLDYETTTSYTLMVVLQDLGTPPLKSHPVPVSIFVLDENDSPPVFTNATYYVELFENATAGSHVITVTATDADSDLHNTIFYSLSGTSDIPTFVIDSSTGVIRLSSSPSLDRETVDQLELAIIASDARNPDDATHTGNATLSVTVLDVDDEPPVFNMSQYNIEIQENYPVDQIFTQLTATDPDIGGDTMITYSLIQGPLNNNNNFTINPTTGQMSFAVVPDHEALGAMNFIQVMIRASDPGGRTGQTSLVVTILDENDNHPKFTNVSYTGSVVEHSSGGDTIVRVMATDRDDLRNGQVFYTLFGNQNFAVVRETGVVYAVAVLDREQRSSYTLTIEARDMGTPSLATNVTVRVQVTDINDNAPEFSQNLYQVEVSEAIPVDSLVVQITAVDMDEGDNANLTYVIMGSNIQQFIVERYTGRLLVDSPLNYEIMKNYSITLQASDGGSPPMTDTTLINITVLDANDNTPIFQPTHCSPCQVEENATVSHIITTVTATDLDSGMNAVIEYSIFEAARSPEISINSTTGEIFIAGSLNYETRREFDLTVMATDMGLEQNTGTVRVVISVTDINDNPPRFIPANATATVRENSADNRTPILTLVTEDADSVSNITYHIMSGNEGSQFTLDTTSGALRANVAFDREQQSSYVLIITAEDNTAPSLTGTTYVTVQIIDVDDSRPSDAQTNVFIYRYQGNAFPQVLGRVFIEDPDVDNTFSYTVLNGPSDVFTISNGMIFYPNNPPTAGEYTLSVMVEDTSGSAISTVRILVVDVSDAMLKEAVLLQLVGVRDTVFAHDNYIRFRQAVASRLETETDMVHLFGLQPLVNRTGWLDVLLAVQTSDNFLQRKTIEHFLHKFRAEIMDEAGVEIFTERGDLCASEPCGGRGECSNIVRFSDQNLLVNGLSVILLGVHRTHDYQCNCLPGYSGGTCEDGMFDFCHSKPCPEIANCSNTLDGYECTCPQGTMFDGDDCMPVGCESLNCANGGSCAVTSNGLRCACHSSFVGDRCEIPLDVPDICADDKPCQQGNCTFSHVGHTCTCPVGFTGNDCGNPTDTNNGGCFQNPCQHGATCIPVGTSIIFNCNCPSGYTGEHCETFLYSTEDKETTDQPVSCQENSCSANERCIIRDNLLFCVTDDCDSSTCLNGGTCIPQYPGFYCFCPAGFDGPRCEGTRASFTGISSSYAVFSSSLQQQLTGNIHLEFVTLSPNGLLLYTGRFDNEYRDVLTVQLVNTTLQLTVSYGGNLTSLSSAVTLSDGVWHEIDIQHNSTVSYLLY